MLYIQSIGWMDVDYLLLGLLLVNVVICSCNYYITNGFGKPNLQLVSIKKSEKSDLYEYNMVNSQLLDIPRSIEAMFYTLTTDETFRNLGHYKIIFVVTVCEGVHKSLHTNTMVTNAP